VTKPECPIKTIFATEKELYNTVPYSISMILKYIHSKAVLNFSLIRDTILQEPVQSGNTRIVICLKNLTRKQV
jgi:hypothetical protein